MFAAFALSVSAVSAIVHDELCGPSSSSSSSSSADAMIVDDEVVEDNSNNNLYLKYKPYLEAADGCVPSSPVISESSHSR